MIKKTPTRTAFTLIELLVVIAIIALLLAALLPAIGAVKNRANIARTQSIFTGLNTGIESYRAEQSLGAGLPPSASDSPSTNPQRIASPFAETVTEMEITGAQLLVMAMMGADGLGTPGFKATATPSDGWWNDTFKGPVGECRQSGLYCIKTDGREGTPRYGPYVDEKLRERAKSVKELGEKGRILNPNNAGLSARVDLPFFTDAWDLPILYYKASAGNNLIVARGAQRGIYRQEDNGLITGSNGLTTYTGLDFGGGAVGVPPLAEAYHYIADATAPPPELTDVTQFLEQTQNTFARYIADPRVRARITPVQRDSYLLISAGPDAQYGTADDLTNWTRETN